MRRFCSWVTETYFATRIWLPNWFIHWVRLRADDEAIGRGLERWWKKHPWKDRF